MLVLLDLSAAFDTISHRILLDRLQEIGVGGMSFNWIQHFLKDKVYCVQLDTFVSSTTSIDRGVPQSSILSPTLFNIYVAPLAQTIRSSGFSVHILC